MLDLHSMKRLIRTIFGRRYTIADLPNREPSRAEIVRRGRILLVDDEVPILLDALKKAGFSIDHLADIDADNRHLVDQGNYDVLLLDFADVGAYFGDVRDGGLNILRQVRRTNPALVVLAYTSKALTASQADFFKLADDILSKDLSIRESEERIERAIRKAWSPNQIWKGLLDAAGVRPGSDDDLYLQDDFVARTLERKVDGAFQRLVESKSAGETVDAMVELAVRRLVSATTSSLLP